MGGNKNGPGPDRYTLPSTVGKGPQYAMSGKLEANSGQSLKIKAVAHVPGTGTYNIENSKKKGDADQGVTLKGRYTESKKLITPAPGHYHN